MSAILYVPASVPSERHGSYPDSRLHAMNRERLPNERKFWGNELISQLGV